MLKPLSFPSLNQSRNSSNTQSVATSSNPTMKMNLIDPSSIVR